MANKSISVSLEFKGCEKPKHIYKIMYFKTNFENAFTESLYSLRK